MVMHVGSQRFLAGTIIGMVGLGTIAPAVLAADAPRFPITEVRWWNWSPEEPWQAMRFTVPDPNVITPVPAGQLRRYDDHLARMFEISYFFCQRDGKPSSPAAKPSLTGIEWDYEIANGNRAVGTFKISCKLTEQIAAAYGFRGAEPVEINRESFGDTPQRTRETYEVPTLNLTGGKRDRWTRFTQQFRPTLRPVYAKKPFPLSSVLPRLKKQTRIPILLPSISLRDSVDPPIDVEMTASADRYVIELYLGKGCRAGACYIGSVYAAKYEDFSVFEELPRDTVRQIQLAKGIQGKFYNGCGAYCTASVEWKSQNVLYRVTGKNADQSDLVELANSAIVSGPR